MTHFNVSLFKSILRMVGFLFLLHSILIAVILLILAEVLGVVEELVPVTYRDLN